MYGLPYYERGNQVMHSEVAPYKILLINFFLYVFVRLASGGVAEGENVVEKVEGGRTPLKKGIKPW